MSSSSRRCFTASGTSSCREADKEKQQRGGGEQEGVGKGLVS